LTVAHVAVGPLEEPIDLPKHVVTRVGHGLLGAGGDHLRRLRAALEADADLADQWVASTSGTVFEGKDGLADALLGRAPHLDVTDVLVATTRVEHVQKAHALTSRTEPLPASVLTALGALIDRSRVASGSPPTDGAPTFRRGTSA
jgi:hypothetical protein